MTHVQTFPSFHTGLQTSRNHNSPECIENVQNQKGITMMSERWITSLAREIGGMLIRLRHKRNWSQEKVALTAQEKGLALSRSTIQRMERGEPGSMSLENLCFYCAALGINPRQILPIHDLVDTDRC